MEAALQKMQEYVCNLASELGVEAIWTRHVPKDVQRLSKLPPDSLFVGWLAGAAAFRITLSGGTSFLAYYRISAATFGVSSVLGCLAVGVGGACASHTFIHTLDYMNSINASAPSPSILNFPIPSPALETVAMSLLAIIGFQLSGGRFRMLAPADLCRVGAFAVESLSATESYAHANQRRLLQQIGRRYGCHHCGARQGRLFSQSIEFIGDHQPPLKYVGARFQRFYPHCPKCSSHQAASVRSNKDALIMPNCNRLYHMWMPWPLLWFVLRGVFYDAHDKASYHTSLSN